MVRLGVQGGSEDLLGPQKLQHHFKSTFHTQLLVQLQKLPDHEVALQKVHPRSQPGHPRDPPRATLQSTKLMTFESDFWILGCL